MAERMKDAKQMHLQLPSSWPQGKTPVFIETFYIFENTKLLILRKEETQQ